MFDQSVMHHGASVATHKLVSSVEPRISLASHGHTAVPCLIAAAAQPGQQRCLAGPAHVGAAQVAAANHHPPMEVGDCIQLQDDRILLCEVCG